MNRDERIFIAREFFSSFEVLLTLPRLLEEFRARCPMGDDQFFNLMVAITEAVNNAIVHGNKSDPTRRVRFSMECFADGVHCVVEDEGEGFDPDAIPDPLSPENLLREGGRGIFLIRSLMRELRLENTGHGMRVEFFCGKS